MNFIMITTGNGHLDSHRSNDLCWERILKYQVIRVISSILKCLLIRSKSKIQRNIGPLHILANYSFIFQLISIIIEIYDKWYNLMDFETTSVRDYCQSIGQLDV